MSKKIVTQPTYTTICDICSRETDDIFREGAASLGWLQAGTDKWEKTISISVRGSAGYTTVEDICNTCVLTALSKIVMDIREEQK